MFGEVVYFWYSKVASLEHSSHFSQCKEESVTHATIMMASSGLDTVLLIEVAPRKSDMCSCFAQEESIQPVIQGDVLLQTLLSS